MARAAELAEPARLVTPPNPWVGCVLVPRRRDRRRRARPVRTRPARTPRPPRSRDAGRPGAGRDRVRHARAVQPPGQHAAVHRRARSPPASPRVVVAVEDPDPRVRGTGVARLRAAGIEVDDRRRRRRGRRSRSRRTSTSARTGRAFALLKTAMSLDGRTAAADGSSQWITGVEAARRRAPRRAPSRRPSSSVPAPRAPTGPGSTVRGLDERGRAASRCGCCSTPAAGSRPTGRCSTRRSRRRSWSRPSRRRPRPSTPGRPPARRSRCVAPGLDGPGCRPRRACSRCWPSSHGVLQAMIEGGGHLHGAFVAEGPGRPPGRVRRAGAARRAGACRSSASPGPDTLADAPRWQLRDVTRLGADVRLTLDPPDSTTPEVGLMFTGIVEELGRVRAARPATRVARASRSTRPRCSTTRSSARRSR